MSLCVRTSVWLVKGILLQRKPLTATVLLDANKPRKRIASVFEMKCVLFGGLTTTKDSENESDDLVPNLSDKITERTVQTVIFSHE